MYRDGYLIKCGPSAYEVPQLLFCVFGDGKVSYYSDKGGKLVGELHLAGHVTKVKVEKAVPGKLPNRFTISTAEVVRVEGRKMKLADTQILEFAAPSHDLMKEWANSLHLWRRMNWKENVKFFDGSSEMSHAEERANLQLFLKCFQETKARRSIGVSAPIKFKNPLLSMMYSTQTPSLKKFRDKMRKSASDVGEPTAMAA
uniref:PH domain-containing protein n=1 Tax=Globisporangium ultimum (strain ATCC 200006 / CBS 805.95 / DAOM BR144) TaxID=431595 RepID=K3XB11_GLOUD